MKLLHTTYTSGRPAHHHYCAKCLTETLEKEPLEEGESVEDVDADYEFNPSCIECGEREVAS